MQFHTPSHSIPPLDSLLTFQKISQKIKNTILTQMMADEFNFPWSEIQNYIAEADADLIPVPGQLELHDRCRYGVLLSPCFGALYLSQIYLWGWRN